MIAVIWGEREKERRSIVKYRFICFPHIHRGSVLIVAQQRNKKGNRKRYHQHTYPTLAYAIEQSQPHDNITFWELSNSSCMRSDLFQPPLRRIESRHLQMKGLPNRPPNQYSNPVRNTWFVIRKHVPVDKQGITT